MITEWVLCLSRLRNQKVYCGFDLCDSVSRSEIEQIDSPPVMTGQQKLWHWIEEFQEVCHWPSLYESPILEEDRVLLLV